MMGMESCCTSIIQAGVPTCDYVPPAVKKLLVRKNKKGQWQVKVNAKGKWIDAEYDEERKTIRYYV